MITEERVNIGRGLPCPECGHVLPRDHVLSKKLITGGPCPECDVTLYVQYVRSRLALTKRVAFVVWPALLGSTFWMDDNLAWWVRTVSSWLLVAAPFLVLVVCFSIPFILFRNKIPFGWILLSTDVGGWSLSRRWLHRNSTYVMCATYIVWGVILPMFEIETSILSMYDLLLLTFLPALTMMILGFPYAETMTAKADVPQEIPEDDGWIAVE